MIGDNGFSVGHWSMMAERLARFHQHQASRGMSQSALAKLPPLPTYVPPQKLPPVVLATKQNSTRGGGAAPIAPRKYDTHREEHRRRVRQTMSSERLVLERQIKETLMLLSGMSEAKLCSSRRDGGEPSRIRAVGYAAARRRGFNTEQAAQIWNKERSCATYAAANLSEWLAASAELRRISDGLEAVLPPPKEQT